MHDNKYLWWTDVSSWYLRVQNYLNYFENFLYFEESEVEKINEFIKSYISRKKEISYLETIVSSYLYSFNANQYPHLILVSLCICLEATTDQRTELTYRIRRKCSIICGRNKRQDFNISILDEIEAETILGLDANIGMSSLYLANKFPKAKIVGVEPDESNVEMFKKNLEQYKNADIILGAVRGDNKNVKIMDYGSGESGYVAEESEQGSTALTIADIMTNYQWKHIDILKMDIEGSEKSVFENNSESWLPKTKILFVELHERKVP